MNDTLNYEERMRGVCAAIERVGKKYAEARALAWLLTEQRKVVLANEMRKPEDGSIAEREMKARSSDVYYQHLVATSKAIHAELSLRAELDKWQASFEALRSLSSRDTARMRIDYELSKQGP